MGHLSTSTEIGRKKIREWERERRKTIAHWLCAEILSFLLENFHSLRHCSKQWFLLETRTAFCFRAYVMCLLLMFCLHLITLLIWKTTFTKQLIHALVMMTTKHVQKCVHYIESIVEHLLVPLSLIWCFAIESIELQLLLLSSMPNRIGNEGAHWAKKLSTKPIAHLTNVMTIEHEFQV